MKRSLFTPQQLGGYRGRSKRVASSEAIFVGGAFEEDFRLLSPSRWIQTISRHRGREYLPTRHPQFQAPRRHHLSGFRHAESA